MWPIHRSVVLSILLLLSVAISACGTPDALQAPVPHASASQMSSAQASSLQPSHSQISPTQTKPEPTATLQVSAIPTMSASTQPNLATSRSSGRIMFVTGRHDQAFAIYSMNGDGSQEQLVAMPNDGLRIALATKFAASPDGKQLALRMDDGSLYRLNHDGSGLMLLVSDEIKTIAPAWSPDGTRIVFYHSDIFDSSKDGIYVIKADGSELTRLTNGEYRDIDPTWAPDSQRIMFVSHRDGQYDLYTMNTDGSALTRVTTDRYEEANPVWSPDGTQIAFVREADLYVVNLDGSGLRQLTTKVGRESDPTWSPDGSRIAYGHADADGKWDIYSVAADGSDEKQLTEVSYADAAPIWLR